MASLTPRFSADRSVREYTEQRYIPGAAAYRARSAGHAEAGQQLNEWRHSIASQWSVIRFGEMSVQTIGDQRVFEVQVYLGTLDPNSVRVELYADALNGGVPVLQPMERIRPLEGSPGGFDYHAQLGVSRPGTDYTARVIPHLEGVAVPLECARILWQR